MFLYTKMAVDLEKRKQYQKMYHQKWYKKNSISVKKRVSINYFKNHEINKEKHKKSTQNSRINNKRKPLTKEQKEQQKIRVNLWLKNNKEKNSLRQKNYIKKNSEKIKTYNSEYYKKNSDLIKKRTRSFYLSNKNHVLKRESDYIKKRLKSDVLFKLKTILRVRILSCLKSNNIIKNSRTNKILGATINDVKMFLENKFQNGMSWDNHGDWHIDHKIPLSSAKNETELLKLFHYTNLQPLWAIDNLKKGSRLC